MSTTVKDVVISAEPEANIISAPALPYEPRDPKTYCPSIAIIGCGGIAASHLRAYQHAGYSIVMLCDLNQERAVARRDEYFPEAEVTTDYRDILQRDDIAVVDIATHPAERAAIIEDSLIAGKHVLSQKPFVLDLATGERLVELAKQKGVTLAVNQNGRWAPHLGYMREAVRSGLIGDVTGIHIRMDWDHSWVKGTVFEKIDDLILYDFAIHWFDFVSSLIPDRKITRVYASKSFAAGQEVKVPMLAQAAIEFDGGQASLAFDGHTRYGHQDTTYIAGTAGSISSTGPSLEKQSVQYFGPNGVVATPDLRGTWFLQGFHGTMAELLCAIEEKRSPLNSAQDNLRSLSLAFTAIASANVGRPFKIGEIVKLWSSKGGEN